MPAAETLEFALALARNARGLVGFARLRLRQWIECRRYRDCPDCQC